MNYDTQESHTTWLYENYVQFETDNYEFFLVSWKKCYSFLISGIYRASLLSVIFINQLMHSIITVVDVKIYVIQKSKRHTLINL